MRSLEALMAPKATVLLVHGAWHGPWMWGALVREMPDVDVRTVALPSVGRDPAALGDLHADAAAIRSAAAAIHGPVLVCAHSYGGVPTTEGVADLSNVVGLVYLCAFQLDIGESLASAAGGAPDWWDVHAAEGYVDAQRPLEIFYADVDEALARDAIMRLGHQSLVAFGQQVTRAAWRTIPSTYIVCEHDMAVPVAAQETMARRAGRVLRISASHSPFLSRPAQLAGILRAEIATSGRLAG
jgi:pimeloyl-ACP methyl ester carboxylesterase